MSKSRSEIKSKENILKCMFAPRNSRLRSLRLFQYVRKCKITPFSYRSSNITKRMEFMHPRVKTTSAFEREKSTEVISPLSAERRRHFPRGTNLFLSRPSPSLPLIYFPLPPPPPLPTLPFVLFTRPSLISLLQVRGLRPMEKPGSNEKGD